MAVTQAMNALRARICSLYYASDIEVARNLLEDLDERFPEHDQIVARARMIASQARQNREARGPLEVFLQEYGLSTQEGIALLCLAEALLRVPDGDTADNLIAEKIGSWKRREIASESAVLNVANRALSLASGVVRLKDPLSEDVSGSLRSIMSRLGEPVVRSAIRQVMRTLGNEFVLGRTIEEALRRAAHANTIASFDMLGEGARTARDAERYLDLYLHCIRSVAAVSQGTVYGSHGVSVKLSALYPRYEYAQKSRVIAELIPNVRSLAHLAYLSNVNLTIDAEEAARLDLSLDIFEALARDPNLRGWEGLGLAVQCYSKRAPAVLDWLISLSRAVKRRFGVRLVKGAYWDTEIKRAQELGVPDYPVFTRKSATDLCYLACAHKALAHPSSIYAQMATHNAYTIAAVLEMAGAQRNFEFQRLHGMGELVYSAARQVTPDLPLVRVYAPVGAHKDLLAYLVRRLLENGANSSFINRYMDERITLDQLLDDPVRKVRDMALAPSQKIPLPTELFGSARRNSTGVDLSDPLQAQAILQSLSVLEKNPWGAASIVSGGRSHESPPTAIVNPADQSDVVGFVRNATPEDLESAVAAAVRAQPAWDRSGADVRADILERAADDLEAQRDRFLSLLVREAGKAVIDAIAEVREAVDFCRYYAAQARQHFGAPTELPGPTGERNLYSLHGRGAWVCISPWNFPLAIFVGQVAAALASGNSVLAKPAAQTPLVATAAVQLLHTAGVPEGVLQLLTGSGQSVGAALIGDERIAGVAMTGSTATAKLINRTLAARQGAIVPLIAETGGQNAMFVDSSALPEQVVDDVIRSAFYSAGQRCSALRVLYLQEEIAEDVVQLIKGAMDQLKVGNPAELSTDIGPVIDEQAHRGLSAHIEQLRSAGALLHKVKLGEACTRGTFIAPHLFAIDSIKALEAEHFGPLLHIVRYRSEDLRRHLEELRETGFGLTMGIHTRIEAVARSLFEATAAGNVYVNRNMTGAVVGVQPFGGHGLSGTGPKAGGPLYLQRFACERTLTINTTASGGNLALLQCQTPD